MVTLPINETLARLAAGGVVHTVIEAECVGERSTFRLCLEIGIKIKLKEPFM